MVQHGATRAYDGGTRVGFDRVWCSGYPYNPTGARIQVRVIQGTPLGTINLYTNLRANHFDGKDDNVAVGGESEGHEGTDACI